MKCAIESFNYPNLFSRKNVHKEAAFFNKMMLNIFYNLISSWHILVQRQQKKHHSNVLNFKINNKDTGASKCFEQVNAGTGTRLSYVMTKIPVGWMM